MPAPAELLRRRRSGCQAVSDALPTLAVGERVDRRVTDHVGQCLRCQAEVAAYKRMARTLQTLRYDARRPAAGTLADLLAAVAGDDSLPSRQLRRTVAYVGVIAVAAAGAGAAATALWCNRRRLGFTPG